jgi:hypothetical protein
MTADDLDTIYGEIARAITSAGDGAAPLFLARLALLALCELDDADRALALIRAAQAVEV